MEEKNMVHLLDLAEYILTRLGPMAASRLQKLLYYCQAWSLVWRGVPLFADKIEAWGNGPIIPALYQLYKGHLKVYANFFYEKEPTKLPLEIDGESKELIETVLEFYGAKDSHWLEQLVHMEEPWRTVRPKPHQHGQKMQEITPASLSAYYCSL